MALRDKQGSLRISENSKDFTGCSMPTALARAQSYRDKSKELREAARSMISEVPQRDMEWMADRYDSLARSVELFEEIGQPKPADSS